MYRNKLLILGIILIFIPSVCAWGEETPIEDNETLNIGFNPMLNESTANNPYPFGLYPEEMLDPLLMSSYLSNDPLTICTSYMIYKQVWDGSDYVQIEDCNISIDECIDLIYNPEKNAYELPANWAQVTSNGFLVKRYFQKLINSDSTYCSNWNSSDDTEFPDVMYTAVDVDASDGETYMGYMYTSLNKENIESFTAEDVDYGYASYGRGGDAGSGGIYEGINLYGAGGGGGMGEGVKGLYYVLIPILFILCVCKFVFKLI